ncbi:ABC transporter ATP-binding protein/permease [Parvimonas micra]|uniref:ABC transporter ATP-binding protein n=1 Tax=Parvimonas micra TaxID=33033 RepID=A0A0B4S126_9FIRM|nr:ABC transporter ATP-binding protein [Parvimonas micra]AIZ36346.1 ABC transporter ATP-binding protein [Parvimonas micra]MBF1275826.1 ABC transporter ATP-binding protein [Parvimonas micra]MBF1306532.1 ABC transporter ATP-binding protein [Parvimonas micra]WBB31885.1 ABC transporter ATP-binding protein/permease [Parvimonas micra]WBB33373.1 ABC transporter ATP-binding protein/permease [Parvimonas micra]
MKKIWKNNLNILLPLFVVMFIYISLEIGVAMFFGYVIDSASGAINMQFSKVMIYTFALLITESVFKWIYEVMSYKFVAKMSLDTKIYIFNNLIKQDIESFYNNDVGDKISILTNDINTIETEYFRTFLNLVKSGFLFLFAFGTIFYVSYQMTIALMILSIISFVFGNIPMKNLKTFKEKFSNSQSEYTARTSEYFNGYETIKVFGLEKFISKVFYNNSKNVYDKGLAYQKRYSLVTMISYFFGGFTFLGGFVCGGYLAYKGFITLGQMIVCVQLTNHIVNPLMFAIESYGKFKSVDKILNKIENTLISEENVETTEIKDFNNKISLEDVSFKYDDKKVLENISFDFEKGKKYALVGLSGSGKSTLMKLISKRIKADEGKICIDGTDLDEISRNSIINLISTINQNVFLFKGSIYDNITLFSKDYSEEKVKDVILKAELGKYLDRLYDKELISENANNLSGGEKQRISIARSLIKDTKIILADEILSSLDNEIAFSIEKGLLELENITLISVTHRLIKENLKQYDKILVLKDGKIEEKGNFEELMNFDSYFKKLYTISEVENN